MNFCCSEKIAGLSKRLIKTISEYNSDDVRTIEGRTYTLNCNGAVGDMLYLTDLDYDADAGHNIVEVKIYRIGEKTTQRPVYLNSQ